jgi:hypothetical protein
MEVLQTVVCKMKNFFLNNTFLQRCLLSSKHTANSWPSSQKSRFLYRIILYDIGTALFLFLNRAAQAA